MESKYKAIFDPWYENGLIEDIFCYGEKKDHMICSLAGWILVDYQLDLNLKKSLCVGMLVDQRYIECKVLKTSSDDMSREEEKEYDLGFRFDEEGALEEMLEKKRQIDAGEIEPLYDPEFVKDLRKEYLCQGKTELLKYGNPPKFSEKNLETADKLSGWGAVIGLPFFYIGRPFSGLLDVGVMVLAGALSPWALILAYLFLTYLWVRDENHHEVKDGKGLYVESIPTQERLKRLSQMINQEEIEV